jgi:malonyl-CoA O-methyltransferase
MAEPRDHDPRRAVEPAAPAVPAPMAAPDAEAAVASRPRRVEAAALQRFVARRQQAAPAWLHGEVARRMAERLPLIRLHPQRLVDWWSAAGGGIAHLAGQYPQAHRIAVEPPPMAAGTAAAAPWARWWRRLRDRRPQPHEVIAAAGLPQQAPVQLLWANMVLHWIDDVPALLAQWQAALQTEGFLMFSCFGPDTLRDLRTLYRSCGWGAAASEFTDLHDLGDALVQAGFADPVMDMEMLRLSWPSPAALLDELRTLGGNTAPQRFAGCRTPRWRARLEAQIATTLAGPDGRPTLAFEIVYGHAFKPPPRLRAGPRTEVPLETMRSLLRGQREPPGP